MKFHDCVEIGFPGVRLLNGFKEVHFGGAPSIQIEAMHGLLRTVLIALCQSNRPLPTASLRIIRQELSLSQTQIASAFDLADRQMIAKYEKGTIEFPLLYQRELKRLLLSHLDGGRVSLKAFETFMRTPGPEILEFSFDGNAWIWTNSPHAEATALTWSWVTPMAPPEVPMQTWKGIAPMSVDTVPLAAGEETYTYANEAVS